MSTIEFNMILSEVDNLARELNRHKDEELSHQDKITVSDLLDPYKGTLFSLSQIRIKEA